MRSVLLNPGPVTLSEGVRRAVTRVDLCHRESEFFDLQDAVIYGLLDVYHCDPEEWSAVLVGGSGTSAMEAMIASLLGIPLFAFLLKMVNIAGENWWLWAWLGVLCFQALLMLIAPAVILPLFNKFTPLPEGPLNVIREHPRNRSLLVVGSEFAVFVSTDKPNAPRNALAVMRQLGLRGDDA